MKAVVFHGIGGIEDGQPRRDLLRHPPRPRAPAREADGAGHVLDVRVDGDVPHAEREQQHASRGLAAHAR